MVVNLLKKLSGSGLGRFRIFSFFIPIAKFFLTKKTVISPEGIQYFLDNKDILNLSLTGGEYNPFNKKLFYTLMNEKDTFVDVGANIGVFSCYIAKKFPKSKVFSFEMNNDYCKAFEKAITANDFLNIELYNKIVSDQSEKKIPIYHYKRNYTNLIKNNIFYKGLKEKIDYNESISLDNFFQSQKVDIVKIDVDGYEPNVLAGMKEVIKKNKNIKIFLEITPPSFESESFMDMLTLFSEKDFVFYQINEIKKHLILLDIREMKKSNDVLDLLIIKKEIVKNLKREKVL